MYARSARFYDALYAWKDYRREAEKLHRWIQQYKRSPGNALLDVACGTGKHLVHLREHYEVEGLDLNAEMLEIARQRLPDVTFHQADMADFDLGRQFDAIVCLFSAIGYVKTLDRLRQALACMRRHVYPGGLVIVEPWFTPEEYHPDTVHATFVDEPDLKIARINVSEQEGRISILDLHYLVGTPAGVEYFSERHELGMFTQEEYLEAFRSIGLEAFHEPDGLTGRGIYVGRRPVEPSEGRA
ncbi:MAG: class I SAM-dependent methyltransferase [Chloroflexi bacterium]|nr:class I SAM-dependent methyltransferase [Chloroflexota bacterium]